MEEGLGSVAYIKSPVPFGLHVPSPATCRSWGLAV